MADSPSPVPESGLATADLWRENLRNAWSALGMIRDAIEELFGPAASLDGPDAVLLRGPEPVDEAAAIVDALSRVAAALESAEASARSARAEAFSMFENELRWHDEAVAYCDAIFEWADARKAMTDAEVTTDVRINPEANAAWRRLAKAEDRLVAIRSLKTAPKGEGEANADDTAPARQP